MVSKLKSGNPFKNKPRTKSKKLLFVICNNKEEDNCFCRLENTAENPEINKKEGKMASATENPCHRACCKRR